MRTGPRIPRKLWFLWHQGLADAPLVVRTCAESWVRENRGWDIVFLDKSNLGSYLQPELPDEKLARLPPAKQSNLIRLQLLSVYGGVWADATTLCMKPLDEWLDACTASGFFAFQRPAKDRLLANWFLAAEPCCPIVVALKKRYVDFFMRRDFPEPGALRRLLLCALSAVFNRSDRTTKYWFSPLITDLAGVYPYFIFHYMFERIMAQDAECRRIWDATAKISADGPHRIQAAGFLAPASASMKQEIDARIMPVYKLSWRYNSAGYTPATLLYYLLEGRAPGCP